MGATSWENLFLPYANNKGADRPVHPRSLISTFVFRCLDSIISLVSLRAIRRIWLVSEAEKTGLSLTWSQLPKTGFLVYWALTGYSCIWGQTQTSHVCPGAIWATSWENLFMPYTNNKGADQPAHPRSLISAFVVRCLDSIIPLLAKSKISRLQLVSVAEQVGLCPTWSQTPKTGFLMTGLILSSIFRLPCTWTSWNMSCQSSTFYPGQIDINLTGKRLGMF